MSEIDDFDKFLGFEDGELDAIPKVDSVKSINLTNVAIEKQDNIIVKTVQEEVIEIKDSNSMSSSMVSQKEYPMLVGTENISQDYKNLSDRLLAQYRMLPYLEYNEIYSEMAELSIKSCPTPTLSVLNLELEKVQASKDRLSEIFVNVLKNYTFKKRAVDILRDSWGKFSNEKSADRRKGEAAFIVSDFESDFALTEALLKASTHILKNLDSLHDNLSRRITIIQLQLKMHDVGRGSLPDFSFDKTPSFIDDISDSKNSQSEKDEDSSYLSE